VATKIAIFAKPNAKKSALLRRLHSTDNRNPGGIEVAIAAPPVDGKANEELVRFLAKLLGVRKSDLEIASGEGGRTKIVLVHTLSPTELDALLDAALL